MAKTRIFYQQILCFHQRSSMNWEPGSRSICNNW